MRDTEQRGVVDGERGVAVDGELVVGVDLEDPAPLGGIGGLQDPASPKGWATCFAVTSTDDAVAAAEKSGGTVTMAPMDTPWGRLATVQDPWGAGFSVMQVDPG